MKTEIASAAVSLFVSSQGSWVEHEQKLLVELPRRLKRAYIKSREAVSSGGGGGGGGVVFKRQSVGMLDER